MNLLVRPLLRDWSRWLRTVWIGSPADSVRTGGGLLVWQEDATVADRRPLHEGQAVGPNHESERGA